MTAIAPLPIFYYALQHSDVHIPIPDYLIAEANRKASKLLNLFGFGALDHDSRALLDMATSYAIVKVALPARIGVSFLLTPWFACQ